MTRVLRVDEASLPTPAAQTFRRLLPEPRPRRGVGFQVQESGELAVSSFPRFPDILPCIKRTLKALRPPRPMPANRPETAANTPTIRPATSHPQGGSYRRVRSCGRGAFLDSPPRRNTHCRRCERGPCARLSRG